MDIHRSYYYYESVKNDSEVEAAIREAAKYGEGCDKVIEILKHDGYPWNHKRIRRVYHKSISRSATENSRSVSHSASRSH